VSGPGGARLVAAQLPLAPLVQRSAAGSWIEGGDGRRYLDGTSGLVCVNVGHAHPHVVAAVRDQLSQSVFASPGMVEPTDQQAYAERLAAVVGRPTDGVLLGCTGTAANEMAVAIARSVQRARGHEGRHKILTGSLSYHGNSALMLALSGHQRRRPHPDDAAGVAPSFASPYAGHHAVHGTTGCREECADDVARAIDAAGVSTVAAVLVEPVNGTTGGGYVPPSGYLRRLREICTARDVLLIHDEVLTGLGRTGLPLGADATAGAQADITVLSKGLGAGYTPISAVLVAPGLLEVLQASALPTPLMGTMSATPLQAAVGMAVLDVLDETGALTPGVCRGDDLRQAVEDATSGSPLVLDVRGRGYFLGVELVPGAQLEVLAAARDRGLLLYPFNGFLPGGAGEGVIIAPPLNVSAADSAFLADALHGALRAATGRSAYSREKENR